MYNYQRSEESPMVHEVVAALIVQGDMILLGLRSPERALYPDVWDMFGGHVEPDEEKQQTLVRELQEELGITPTEWTFLETLTLPLVSPTNEEPDEIIVHLYRVTAWKGTPINRQTMEHSRIGWFSLAQAIQLALADSIYPTLFVRHLNSKRTD